MAEQVSEDRAAKQVLASQVLIETADSPVGGIEIQEQQTAGRTLESVTANTQATQQEYVHQFRDGTTITYALTAIKECPVASKMTEAQLKLILELSALGMRAMMPAETIPKTVNRTDMKDKVKITKPEQHRQAETNRLTTPDLPVAVKMSVLTAKEEAAQVILPLPAANQKEEVQKPVIKLPRSRSRRQEPDPRVVIHSVRPVAQTNPVAIRRLSVVRPKPDKPIPPTADTQQKPSLIVRNESMSPVMDGVADSENFADRPVPVRLDEEVMIVGTDTVESADWPISAAELSFGEPANDSDGLDIVPEDVFDDDVYPDELIDLWVTAGWALDSETASSVNDEPPHEMDEQVDDELVLPSAYRLYEQDLTDFLPKPPNIDGAEGILSLDEATDEVIDLSMHGTHEAKYGLLPKLLPAWKLHDHLEYILGIFSVHCTFTAV